MRIKCEKCGHEYEVGKELQGQAMTCQCGHSFIVPYLASEHPEVSLNNSVNVSNVVKSGGGTGSLVCSFVFLVLAILLNNVSNFLIFLYLPMYLIAFILGIVAMCHHHALLGATSTLLSIIMPVVLFGKNIAEGTSVFDEANEKANAIAEKEGKRELTQDELAAMPSFMGVQFGSEFHKLHPNIKGKRNEHGEMEYMFTTPKPFMGFGKCVVTTTAIGGRVSKVSSEYEYESIVNASAELDKACAVIESHYGTKQKKELFSHDNRTFEVGDMTIRLHLHHGFDKSSLRISADSLGMFRKAEAERKEYAVKSVSAEGL